MASTGVSQASPLFGDLAAAVQADRAVVVDVEALAAASRRRTVGEDESVFPLLLGDQTGHLVEPRIWSTWVGRLRLGCAPLTPEVHRQD